MRCHDKKAKSWAFRCTLINFLSSDNKIDFFVGFFIAWNSLGQPIARNSRHLQFRHTCGRGKVTLKVNKFFVNDNFIKM